MDFAQATFKKTEKSAWYWCREYECEKRGGKRGKWRI